MRDWLRLFEENTIYGPEDEDPMERAESERYAKQRRIEADIQKLCEKNFGWSFSRSYAVNYDMDEQEISISPDEEEVTLSQLQVLAGMGKEITVTASGGNYSLRIVIKVSDHLQVIG